MTIGQKVYTEFGWVTITGKRFSPVSNAVVFYGPDMNGVVHDVTSDMLMTPPAEPAEEKKDLTSMIVKGLKIRRGLKGEKGDRGYTGFKGEKGDSIVGPKGEKGDKGEPGDDGKDGKNGKDGKEGKKGEKGERGLTGPKGKDGKDGKDGLNGLNGLNGGGGIHKIDDATDVKITNPTDNQSLTYDAATKKWVNETVVGGSGGHTIEDEGTPLATRTKLNFVGAGVTVTDDSGDDATVVTISGGGSGTVDSIVAGNNIDVDATDPANPIVSVEILTLADISDVTASATEVNYTDGVTSSIQTQLNAKAADADVVHDTGDETIAGVKTFSSDPLIPDEAYGAGWNGSLEPATKNALYDKIETLGGGSGITRTVTVTSGSFTAGSTASTDYVYLIAGAHPVALPTAVGNSNRYTFKNNHSAAITITPDGAETVEGSATIQVAPEDSVDLISNNTSNWNVI